MRLGRKSGEGEAEAERERRRGSEGEVARERGFEERIKRDQSIGSNHLPPPGRSDVDCDGGWQNALFGVPAPSASSVAGKPALPVAGAAVPRALVSREGRQPGGPAGPGHVPAPSDASVSSRGRSSGLGRDDVDEAESAMGEDADRWADVEPDAFWSDEDDRDAASVAGSGKSHWSSSSRRKGTRGQASLVRHSLSRPRLLRQLLEEVVLVVLGDGFSIVLCNKKEAASGSIAAQEMRVSSKLRHDARIAQRSYDMARQRTLARREEKMHTSDKRRARGKDTEAGKTIKAQEGRSGRDLVDKPPMCAGELDGPCALQAGGHEDEKAGRAPERSPGAAATAAEQEAEDGEIEAAAVVGQHQSGPGGGALDVVTAIGLVAGSEVEREEASTPTETGSTTTSATPRSASGASDDGEARRTERGGEVARRKQGGGEKRSGGRRGTGRMKTVEEGGEVAEDGAEELRQGWMLVHEVVVSFRLPGYHAKHIKDAPMQWDKRWAVLYRNELMIFDHPAEAQPLFKVLLDGYFVSDYTHEAEWGGPTGVPRRKKSPGESRIPTLELQPNALSSSCAANARYLYCRCKGVDDLREWITALREAAVLRMVRNTMMPATVKPWDVDVDWSLPDAAAAWDSWREPEEREATQHQLAAGGGGGALAPPLSTSRVPSATTTDEAGSTAAVETVETAGAAPGTAGPGGGGAGGAGSTGGFVDMMVAVVTGMTPRLATPRSSVSVSCSSSLSPAHSDSGGAGSGRGAAGPGMRDAAGAGVSGKDAGGKEAVAATLGAATVGARQRVGSGAGGGAGQGGGRGGSGGMRIPEFAASKSFFPALVGTHMEEMSRVLDETRKQVAPFSSSLTPSPPLSLALSPPLSLPIPRSHPPYSLPRSLHPSIPRPQTLDPRP